MAVDFWRMMELLEGMPGAPPPQGDVEFDTLTRNAGVPPGKHGKTLKAALKGIYSGAWTGPPGDMSSTRAFTVKDADVDGRGHIEDLKVKFFGTGDMGPTGIQNVTHKGDHYWEKPPSKDDKKNKVKMVNTSWWNKIMNQAGQQPQGAGATGALPGMM